MGYHGRENTFVMWSDQNFAKDLVTNDWSDCNDQELRKQLTMVILLYALRGVAAAALLIAGLFCQLSWSSSDLEQRMAPDRF